jgi:tetratricopeptide (TPR) repeat protein
MGEAMMRRPDGTGTLFHHLAAGACVAVTLGLGLGLLAAGSAQTAPAAPATPTAATASTIEEIAALPSHQRKEALDAFLKRDPSSAEGNFQLGIWNYEEGHLTEALDAFKKVLSMDPGQFRALANASLVLTDLKRDAEALTLFEKFIAKNPKEARAIAFYGETLWTLGRRTEGVEQYRKALSIDPKCAEAHFNMAVAFAEMGIFREAIREWREVVTLGDPDHLVRQAKENIARAEQKL